MAPVGIAGLYLIASLCAGALVMRALTNDAPSPLVSPPVWLATIFFLGQGTLAALWLLLALCGWFKPLLVALLVFCTLLLGMRLLLPEVKRCWKHVIQVLLSFRAEAGAWRVLLWLLFLLLAVEGVGSLLPPRPRSDATLTYLTLPKIIATSHRLLPLAGHERFVEIGLQGELHYAALMSIDSWTLQDQPQSVADSARLAQPAKFFCWVVTLNGIVLLLGVGAAAGLGSSELCIALTLLLTSTSFTNLITNGKVDLIAAGLGIGAFYWTLQASGSRRTLAVRLTSLLAGLAIVAKLSYLVALLPGILVMLVWQQPCGESIRTKLRSFASVAPSFCLWIALPLLPHLVKNTILFGEPLRPVLTGEQSWVWKPLYPPDVTRRIVLTYPAALVYGRYSGQTGQVSPLVLAFAPLLSLLAKPPSLCSSQLFRISVAATLGIAAWILLSPSNFAPRYVLAPLAVLVLPVAYAAGRVLRAETGRWFSVGIQTCLFAVLLLTLVQEGRRKVSYEALQYYFGGDPGAHLNDPICRAAETVNRRARPGERVYLGSLYGYWLRSDLLQEVPAKDEIDRLASGFATPEERWTYLWRSGFRYVIIDRESHALTATRLDPTRLPAGLELTTLFQEDEVSVYHLRVLELPRN